MQPADRLIVALDVASASEARRIAGLVRDSAGIFKVGKQLFTAEGPDVVRELSASGRIFLDLKFHDIPNTVAGAVREATKFGVHMLTVHASGGANMLRAAVAAARETSPGPQVLAVTVLTSLSDNDLQEIGVSGRVLDQVLRLASLARAQGCDGVVASAREAAELRKELGSDFSIVTPGVRPAGSPAGDQARVLTAAQALQAGASHIVVGRPITEAADPRTAARAILDEIASVCG